jgi:hypothetical protein
LLFKEGLAAVEDTNGKWGFINTNGEFVVKPVYDYAESFQNGLAVVWDFSKMYYVNKKGELISEVFWEKEKIFWIW